METNIRFNTVVYVSDKSGVIGELLYSPENKEYFFEPQPNIKYCCYTLASIKCKLSILNSGLEEEDY